MIHILKIRKEFYDLVRCGCKKAELRFNDRNFKVGDFITFINVDGTEYPYSTMIFDNIYLITNVCYYEEALKDNYVMLSIEQCIIVPRHLENMIKEKKNG